MSLSDTDVAAAREPIRPAVKWTAAGAGLTSGAALVGSIVTGGRLWLWCTFIVVPGFIAIVALSVMARREQQEAFLARLKAGIVAGVLGTIAYDISRYVVEALEWSSTNSFGAMPAFGSGLTTLPTNDPTAIAAGWVFHAVNGVGFAIAYVMVMAGRRWPWAILYALVLEAFMVGLYPGWLGVTLSREFLSVSVMGHVFYGAVLGIMAERAP